MDSRTTVTGRTLPEGRYGSRRPRPSKRRFYWVMGACGVLLGVVVAFVGYRNLGSAPIEAQRTAFSVVDGTSMRISFDVSRDEPRRPAVCIVRVRAVNGSETGRREVLIPPGGTTVEATAVIHSAAEPVTAEVFGCSYQVPEYLSSDLRPTG